MMKTNPVMVGCRRLAGGFCAAAFAALLLPNATAATIYRDMMSLPDNISANSVNVWLDGTVEWRADVDITSGSGQYVDFFEADNEPSEEGYNTNHKNTGATPYTYDQVGGVHTKGVWFNEILPTSKGFGFFLDINESQTTPDVSLDQFAIFLKYSPLDGSVDPIVDGYNAYNGADVGDGTDADLGLGIVVYSLNDVVGGTGSDVFSTDEVVLVDEKGGSGNADYGVYIPGSMFAAAMAEVKLQHPGANPGNTAVFIYTKFGGLGPYDNGGANGLLDWETEAGGEQWSNIQVPEPQTYAMFMGLGLLGFIGFRSYREHRLK